MMRVTPDHELVPDKVMIPVPAFVTERVALPSLIVPENVVVALVLPVVSVIDPTAELVTPPVPAREPIESDRPARSKVAVEATVTLLPANQRLSPMPFHPNEVTIYGKVVTVIRKVD